MNVYISSLVVAQGNACSTHGIDIGACVEISPYVFRMAESKAVQLMWISPPGLICGRSWRMRILV